MKYTKRRLHDSTAHDGWRTMAWRPAYAASKSGVRPLAPALSEKGVRLALLHPLFHTKFDWH
jgi:hypothetical protein